MDLTISHISFADFRSYEAFDLRDIGPLTIIVGPNAVGKTNIVEGIQLLTAHASFRHPTVAELVRMGATRARLYADVTDGNRQLELEMTAEEGKKRFFSEWKAEAVCRFKGIGAVGFVYARRSGAGERRDGSAANIP